MNHVRIMCGSYVEHHYNCSDAYASLHVSIPAVLEHHLWVMCRSSAQLL